MGEPLGRLELGELWVRRFCGKLPLSSVRMRTRMAWRLAALGVETDETFAAVSLRELATSRQNAAAMGLLRQQYLKAH